MNSLESGDFLAATEQVIERFEDRASRATVDVDTLFQEWRTSKGAQVFTSDQQSEIAVELLRVWMEFQFEAGRPVSVMDACSKISNVNISEHGVELLKFEHQRLMEASMQSGGLVPTFPDVGSFWNGFKLIGILGEGSIARVFLAKQSSMSNRLVALKLTARQTSESALLARIQHSGVVPIYSVHHLNGLYGVCMPYVGSTTLADLMEKEFRTTSRSSAAETRVNSRFSSLRARFKGLVAVPEQFLDTVISGQTIVSRLQERQSLISTWIKSGQTALSLNQEAEQELIESGSAPSESSSPNLVSTFDDGEVDNLTQEGQSRTQAFKQAVRELPANHDLLNEASRKLGQFDYTQVVLWFGIQLADALHHVHCCGVVHFDVKPANVLLGYDGQVRLLDFNVSQQEESCKHQEPSTDQLMGGTPAYMAPEQREALLCNESCQPKSSVDIYSLGAVLFEMLTGQKPAQGTIDLQQQLRSSLADSQLRLSRGLQAVILKSMAFNPDARYESAEQFSEDLRSVLNHQPLIHVPEPSRWESLEKWRKRHPRLASGGSVATLAASLLLCVGLWGWFQGQERQWAKQELAIHELSRDLPVAVSLFSAVSEFDELQDDLHVTLKRVFQNLEHLRASEIKSGRGQGNIARIASIAPDLVKLQSMWSTQIGNSGGALSPLYSIRHSVDQASIDKNDFQNLGRQLGIADSGSGKWLSEFSRYYSRSDYMKAIEYAEANPAEFEDYASVLLLGHCYLLTKQYQRASNVYSEAIAMERSVPLATFYRGVAMLGIEAYRQAEADFRSVLDREPRFISARYNLGLVLSKQQKWLEAEVAFSAIIDEKQDSSRAWLARARVRAKLNNATGAQADVLSALKTKPRRCSDLLEIGQLLASSDLTQAISCVREAIERFPNNLDARQTLAHLLSLSKGTENEAIQHLDQVLKMDSRNALALGGRAVLLARAGRVESAVIDLERLEEQNPQDPMLMYQISCGYSLIAQYEKDSATGKPISECDFNEPQFGGVSGMQSADDRRQVQCMSSWTADASDAMRQSIVWYKKAVFADHSICKIAASDPDVRALRGTDFFNAFQAIVLEQHVPN